MATKAPDTVVSSDAGQAAPRKESSGLLCGIGAYTLWGVFPLYFRALAEVPPFTILCHRIVWSSLFLIAVVAVRREWGVIRSTLRSPRQMLLLCAGAILIALNWLIFIYAVSSRQVLQASLGYFINPLLSIALGMIFLGERLRRWQWVAVLVAAVAVANQALHARELPWIAVTLAVTFGFYGLVRKNVTINSLPALLVETTLLVPFSLVALALLPARHFSATSWGLLSVVGFVTAIPLLLFGAAVRRLKLSTVGFLQYIGPSLQFAMATVVFGEHVAPSTWSSFLLCWTAIAIYVVDSVLHHTAQPVADEPE